MTPKSCFLLLLFLVRTDSQFLSCISFSIFGITCIWCVSSTILLWRLCRYPKKEHTHNNNNNNNNKLSRATIVVVLLSLSTQTVGIYFSHNSLISIYFNIFNYLRQGTWLCFLNQLTFVSDELSKLSSSTLFETSSFADCVKHYVCVCHWSNTKILGSI